jgi:hypothetical protein
LRAPSQAETYIAKTGETAMILENLKGGAHRVRLKESFVVNNQEKGIQHGKK